MVVEGYKDSEYSDFINTMDYMRISGMWTLVSDPKPNNVIFKKL